MKYWFKNSIIYSLNVDLFKDDDKDGRGDIDGLKERLEYVSGMGFNTIWLLPVFSTPGKDNGYDVSDYYNIDARKGNMGTFVEFMDLAEDFNLKVLIDLPLNHTSSEHPWFQEACNNPSSKYRDYYIWSDEKPQDADKKLMFEGQQESNWKFDEKSNAYYYHTFYDFQPDLNYANPEVKREIRKIIHFWLRLGVSGFRVDAVPHVIRNKGHVKLEDPHSVLRGLRQFVEEIKSEAVLLGETDVNPEDYQQYFGNGNEFHMLLNFYLTNYIFLSLARKDKRPIEYSLKQLPPTNLFEQYTNFLRNHDELDLEQLSEKEREEVFKEFAPEDDMRIFGRGIRRRLAPMLNDQQRSRLAYSILFSMPGTPVIRYGDELGMGDDLSLFGRKSVQTVMQWSAKKNAGFSDAEPDQLVRPAIDKGDFGYKHVNVADQQRDPESFLNWMEKLIGTRTKCMEFGRGNFLFLDTGTNCIMCHASKLNKEISVVFHNFSDQPKECAVSLEDHEISEFNEMFADDKYQKLERHAPVKLNPFGFRWFKGKLKEFYHPER